MSMHATQIGFKDDGVGITKERLPTMPGSIDLRTGITHPTAERT